MKSPQEFGCLPQLHSHFVCHSYGRKKESAALDFRTEGQEDCCVFHWFCTEIRFHQLEYSFVITALAAALNHVELPTPSILYLVSPSSALVLFKHLIWCPL